MWVLSLQQLRSAGLNNEGCESPSVSAVQRLNSTRLGLLPPHAFNLEPPQTSHPLPPPPLVPPPLPTALLTFIRVVAGRGLQERHAGGEGHVPLVGLRQAAGAAALLVGLPLLALHLLLVHGPPLELLRAPLLGRPQPLQAGHLVQLLQLLDQLQVVGHGGWWSSESRRRRW